MGNGNKRISIDGVVFWTTAVLALSVLTLVP